MTEILLIRHAQSYANKRDFTAFGNHASPLTEKGIEQSLALGDSLRENYGFDPKKYAKPVLASELVRPKQTAEVAGFKDIHVSGLINECEMKEELGSGVDVIDKHRRERWVPVDTENNASIFIDRVSIGELDYEMYFTHGMFVASVLLELEKRNIPFDYDFDTKRGYVPLQTAVVKLEVPDIS